MERAQLLPPLVPGAYAGPVKARRHQPPAFTHRIVDWVIAILLPVAVFIGVMVLQAYYKKKVAHADGIVVLLVFSFLAFAIFGFRSGKLLRGLHGVLCLVATIAGAVCGYNTFLAHFNVAFEFDSLVTYVNIDPARDVGGAYSDAGEVYFKEGSRVDTERPNAVMSKDIFCVAPIVREEAASAAAAAGGVLPPPSGTVDWWAVGKNCCKPDGKQFNCGFGRIPPGVNARAGLRQLYDFERHQYRIAVDEWSSEFDLPVNHPLFFEWVVDPLADVTNHVLAGWRQLYWYMEAYTIANLVIATLGTSVVVDLLEG